MDVLMNEGMNKLANERTSK